MAPSQRSSAAGDGGRGRRRGTAIIPVVLFVIVLVLAPLYILAAPFTVGMLISSGIQELSSHTGDDQNELLHLQHLKSILTKESIDSISATQHDVGRGSSDSFSTNHISSPWLFDEVDITDNTSLHLIDSDQHMEESYSSVQLEIYALIDSLQNRDNGFVIDSQIHFPSRKLLGEENHENGATMPIQQFDEAVVRLENVPIERSKAVDSAVLGKYSIWRKENENENSDSTVRLIRDQIIMGRIYSVLAKEKNRLDLYQELLSKIKESQHLVAEANADTDLHPSASDKITALAQVLSKAREVLYDCNAVTRRLRAMLQSADEQVRSLKKQSTFLSQLAAKTIPNGINCLSMRLTIDYYLLPQEKRIFPRRENLENPDLYHYALFSDNVLAASVVVNSTIMNAKEPEKHVFHLVTDKLNFGAMNMWFLLNPPGKATINVENVDDFKWLNSTYCPVLRQLESAAMKEYYFKSDHPSSGSSNLKYRNPKYLSMLNHLRFYLPEVYPKLNKILFLDDDIVVQKDLTALWSVDLNGNVNGAVETCGESFHRFDKYLNFSNPLISQNFDPNACGWAYGMNMFDLKEWKKKDITGIYHKWQNMNEDRVLWKLGTLPPGLLTFYKLTHPLDKSWHVLGLGYNPTLDRSEIDNAAVVHYNGNMKPWLELAMTRYRPYWTKYINYEDTYVRACKISE